MKGQMQGSFHKGIWKGSVVCLLGAAVPMLAMAQWPAVSQQPPVQQQWPGAQPSPEPVQQAPQPRLSPEQLDDLVAPIALYPDPLLGQLLVASTYPLELVEAQQWLTQNHGLQGQQLMDASRQRNWDPSVQAMVAFPEVLARLTQDVSWTTGLGNAFLAQQADVMAAVQTMRARAQANYRLSSSPQQMVTTETQGDQSAIAIQPADPQLIYVPQYDPNYVWGPPAWGAYPPLYYPSFGYGYWPGIDIGLSFGGWGGWGGWGRGFSALGGLGGLGGAGTLAGSLLGGWGWNPLWLLGSVLLNNGFLSHFGFHSGSGYGGYGGSAGYGGGTYWAHDPIHRLGVPYPNQLLTGRFGAASLASRANTRSFEGRNSFGPSYGGNRVTYGGGGGAYAGRSGPQGYGSYGNQANRGYAGGGYGGYRNGATNGYARGYQAPGGAPEPGGARYTQPGAGSYNRSYGSAPVVRSSGSGGYGGSYTRLRRRPHDAQFCRECAELWRHTCNAKLQRQGSEQWQYAEFPREFRLWRGKGPELQRETSKVQQQAELRRRRPQLWRTQLRGRRWPRWWRPQWWGPQWWGPPRQALTLAATDENECVRQRAAGAYVL